MGVCKQCERNQSLLLFAPETNRRDRSNLPELVMDASVHRELTMLEARGTRVVVLLLMMMVCAMSGVADAKAAGVVR
jgi:hypothetical protein